jgi:threonine synthase
MYYFGLNNRDQQVTFKHAAFSGLAPGSGLYFPAVRSVHKKA